ncbi:hypothetical protein M404DRAFT_998566 [Pisolithus tinctorius Marx 270]|uniref:Uncharacterized protein n=1 Tax=Pisolithus tinctorius Marx 270 TaxID=870435 RepID=A0A0C3IA78_PISTI|nr:hypothetical protein M404DRAFT_1008631 [Pisolithus tinctorius Marx 270]KIO07173.1 hypothetical protein M404DRAFT_998566 [Pisolithus tinctorius Marx 270]
MAARQEGQCNYDQVRRTELGSVDRPLAMAMLWTVGQRQMTTIILVLAPIPHQTRCPSTKLDPQGSGTWETVNFLH